MADHNGGKDPISGTFETLLKGAMGIFSGIFVLGMILGGITGNAPVRASLFDVWAWGQICGAWINAGGNAGIQTFGSEEYFQNSKQIGSDRNPRLITPSRPSSPNTLPLPASDRRTTSDLSGTTATPVTYQDLDGDGIITPDEIAKQNK